MRKRFSLVSRLAIVLTLALAFYGCLSEPKADTSNLADLNIILETDLPVDSVWVSDISQRKSNFYQYRDTIKVDFGGSMDDLYNISFFTQHGIKGTQLWLNGNQVIVKGKFTGEVEIDTVLNSDLYHKSRSYTEKFKSLIQANADSLVINDFLIKNIREHVESPFSLALSGTYIERNQNSRPHIQQLFNILSTQNDTLKNHLISVHGLLENILKVDYLNLPEYRLRDLNNQETTVELSGANTYLLDFWFVNCKPCVKDHKKISQDLDFLVNEQVELIGFSTDPSHEEWLDYLKRNNYKWRNYLAGISNKLVADLAVWSYPTYLHVDSEGKILGRYNQYEDFKSDITK